MTAIRLITMHKPSGWYESTKDKVEEGILRKWSRGYWLVYLGQNLLPYGWILLVFGLMWWKRQLHVLSHNFWWANEDATKLLQARMPGVPVLTNPVVANLTELVSAMDHEVYGGNPSRMGLLPDPFDAFSVESTCGWTAIRDSSSGWMQAILVMYGVPS